MGRERCQGRPRPGLTASARPRAGYSRVPATTADNQKQETPVTDSKDMTIRDVRVTVLRMPWANPAWIKGHALGPDRGVLIVDVETAGGITGMGYLLHFRPGLNSIATFLDEVVIPRVKGKDAT